MKKRSLLIVLMVAIFALSFALTVSAAEPDLTKETVTLSDGTVCALWDTDGAPLTWYKASSGGYAYIKSTDITYTESWSGGSAIAGVTCYQASEYKFTVSGTGYSSKSHVVVANMMADIKTSKGNPLNCFSGAYTDSKVIEYVYFPLNTVALQANVLRNCTSLKYSNLESLTELNTLSTQTYKGLTSLVDKELDLTGTKITSIGEGALAENKFTSILLPNTVTSLGNWSLQGNSMTSFTLPSSLKNAGSNLLKNCTSLVNVYGLKELIESGTMTYVPSFMFNGCNAIGNIDGIIADGVYAPIEGCTSLGGGVFPASKVTKIIIPKSAVTLSSDFCNGYSNLIEVVGFKYHIENGNYKSTSNYMFNNCTNLVTVDGLYENGHMDLSVFPNITSISEGAFKGLKTLTSINIPYGIKQINNVAFQDCTAIKSIKLPTTISTLKAAVFYNCSSLEFVDFGENTNKLNMNDWGVFGQCSSLVAISLPANTPSIPDRCFTNCQNLKALYIGETTVSLCGNKSDGVGDGPAFAQCYNMYFVQKPFSVTKADGSFYTAEEFASVMPSKPSVYYFPETLIRICNIGNRDGNCSMDANGHVKNGGSDDLAFVSCKNLNSTLVFPVGFTGFDDISNSLNPDQRGDTMTKGFMHNCATAENPVSLVFLGKIHRLSMDRRNGFTSYMTYVFANEGNTGFEDTLIGSYIGDEYYSNMNEMYVVFCHTNNGAGAKYKIEFAPSSDTTKGTPVLKPTLIENAQTHIIDIKASVIVDPDCITKGTSTNYCFCGVYVSTTDIDPLGHNHDVTVLENLSNYFESIISVGIEQVKCTRCDDKAPTGKTLPQPIYTNGFAVTNDGYLQGYGINFEMILEYLASVGKTIDSLDYGVVAGSYRQIQGNDPINSDGTTYNDKTHKFSYKDTDYVMFDIKIKGLTEAYANEGVILCAYVILDGTVYYISNEVISEQPSYYSLNDVNGIVGIDVPETVDYMYNEEDIA